MDTDITDVLGSIRVPTLVLHREPQRGEARYMVERIPGANAIELSGTSQGRYSDDVVEALLAFVRGTDRRPPCRSRRRDGGRAPAAPFFCRFDGPARAIACARAVVEDARSLELEVRAGVHTGECEVVGEKIAGIAMNVGARVAAAAAPGEVLVSGTVRDLVAASGLSFEDRGEHELKGVPGTLRLFSVVA